MFCVCSWLVMSPWYEMQTRSNRDTFNYFLGHWLATGHTMLMQHIVVVITQPLRGHTVTWVPIMRPGTQWASVGWIYRWWPVHCTGAGTRDVHLSSAPPQVDTCPTLGPVSLGMSTLAQWVIITPWPNQHCQWQLILIYQLQWMLSIYCEVSCDNNKLDFLSDVNANFKSVLWCFVDWP